MATEPQDPAQEEEAAPRTPLELQLLQLWEQLLGVAPIGIGDDFFALGGDSMAAVELQAHLERRFGAAPPLDRLLPSLTVERLARLLGPAVVRDGGAAPLVALQPEGDLPPFFCVHPSGGSVLCYLDLARRLGVSQPFYGLAGPDPRGGGEPRRRVEEMAAEYLAAVRQARPHGPYQLGGYSFGGYVALEMARLLAAAGEVPLLVLIDSRAPAGAGCAAQTGISRGSSSAAEGSEPSRRRGGEIVEPAEPAALPDGGVVADLSAVLERHDLDDRVADLAAEKALWDDLTALAEIYVPAASSRGGVPPGLPGRPPGPADRPHWPQRPQRPRRMGTLQRFFRQYRFLPAGEEMDYRDVRRYMRFLRANFRSARAYAPLPYPHGAVLLQTGETLTAAETPPAVHAARWAALIQGGLEVRCVPGHHLNLLLPPAVDGLAAALRRCLTPGAAAHRATHQDDAPAAP